MWGVPCMAKIYSIMSKAKVVIQVPKAEFPCPALLPGQSHVAQKHNLLIPTHHLCLQSEWYSKCNYFLVQTAYMLLLLNTTLSLRASFAFAFIFRPASLFASCRVPGLIHPTATQSAETERTRRQRVRDFSAGSDVILRTECVC